MSKSVSIFMRSPASGGWSIERVFNDIVAAMPGNFQPRIVVCPYTSSGLWNRIKAIFWAPTERADVNHISGDIHFVSFLLPRRNTILTIHDCGELNKQNGIKRFALRLLWFQIPVAKTAIVTTVSERTKADLLSVVRCDPDRVRVIYNPVSAAFRPRQRSFNAEKPRLLQVGTNWNKNLDRVIEAVAGLSCTLVIIGRLTQAQIDSLQQIEIDFESHVDITETELVWTYQSCDIVVFASLFEGFGLPAIEAQMVGCPLVTSRGPPFDEVVGSSACLVDPYDTSSIRQGILRVIQDDEYRQDLIAQGFQNAKRFTPKIAAEEYARIYQELVNHEPRR